MVGLKTNKNRLDIYIYFVMAFFSLCLETICTGIEWSGVTVIHWGEKKFCPKRHICSKHCTRVQFGHAGQLALLH